MPALDIVSIPLSLYVHVPWCVRKCPYCDFNSHALDGELPETEYVDTLLDDLRREWDAAGRDALHSVFIGGGTPSLLSPAAVERLLRGIERVTGAKLPPEVTLEANPGTLERGCFADFRNAGINRLSLGVQSLDDRALGRLGRIHDADQALRAIDEAIGAGFERLNLDLMFGLPGQDVTGAMRDLDRLLACDPGHLSWYQLTIEPNTLFHHRPPGDLPDDDLLADIQAACEQRLLAHGYAHYEISAWARPGHTCRHNLNYWLFGDYLAIGAGAHGKLSLADGRILRYSKPRHPRDYLAGAQRRGVRELSPDDRLIEFMLNALRLEHGYPVPLFEQRTGLDHDRAMPALADAESRDWITREGDTVRPTPAGRRYLNDLLALFTS